MANAALMGAVWKRRAGHIEASAMSTTTGIEKSVAIAFRASSHKSGFGIGRDRRIFGHNCELRE
jgi:hypothetical protein